FFFSSRRRHTRSTRDWSSDVCSSDLARYFRFTETQAVILELLRDPIDAPALASAVAGRLGGAVPLATIEGFLKSLEDKWLLDTRSEERRVGKRGEIESWGSTYKYD